MIACGLLFRFFLLLFLAFLLLLSGLFELGLIRLGWEGQRLIKGKKVDGGG